MKALLTLAFLALLAPLSAGCAQDDETSPQSSAGGASAAAELTADQAKTKAKAIIPEGEVQSVERVTEGDHAHHEILLKMPKGGVIEVVLVAADGSLDKIESKTGPFDYEITPKQGVLTYTAAREKALAVKKGDVEVWEYSEPENQWEFYVRDVDMKLWEVKMKANDGTITDTEEKVKPD